MKLREAMLIFLAILLAIGTGNVYAQQGITVRIDGNELKTDVAPQTRDGRTLVPMRDIFEALGASVKWDAATKSISAVSGDKANDISMTIGAARYYVNGKAKEMDVPACIVDGRTMVPARVVAESLGYNVGWDGQTKCVNISAGGNNTSAGSIKTSTGPSSTGLEIGKSYVSYLQEPLSMRTADVMLPSFCEFTEYPYYIDTEEWDDGYYKAVFTFDEDILDSGLMDTYINQLKRSGFSLGDKLEDDWGDITVYYMLCSANVTHGSVSYLGEDYDMAIEVYSSWGSNETIVTLKYPEEIYYDFAYDLEDFYEDEVPTIYNNDYGKDHFKISGWSEDPDDYIDLYLDPAQYKEGSIIDKKTFAAQPPIRDNPSCSLLVKGRTMSGGEEFGALDASELDSVTVEVLERNSNFLTIAYRIEVTDDVARNVLEGTCVAAQSGGTSSQSTETGKTSNGKFELRCTVCDGHGIKKCPRCGGQKELKCNYCGGDGEISKITGSSTIKIRCTHCTGGTVKCDFCGGKGTVKCTNCDNGIIRYTGA